VKRALLLALAVGALLAGCGDDSTSETTTTAAKTTSVRVYFLRDGKVWPVTREVEEANVASAVDALRAGPTDEEQSELGVTTAVLPLGADLYGAALAQLVYTLTQFPDAGTAEIDGKSYTRADFEEQTPIILVESPLPFEEVTSPLRVTGTANTFEATFQYELVDKEGKVVDKNFVTATSGTGTRGTFDFTTKKVEDVAALRVFELSAEDGSRIHEVEIPLTTTT
jgi:Immunoglobulin-like domain of bacterial spore germination